MTRMRWLVGLVAIAGVWACDGGSSTASDGGGADGVADSGGGGGGGGSGAVRDLDAPRAMLGYLYAQCPWQAFPSLPEVGDGCALDVFLVAGPVTDGVPSECAGGEGGAQPFTSRCLLDALGVTIEPGTPIRVDGAWGKTQACTIPAKDEAPTCADGPVFAVTGVGPAYTSDVYELVVDRALSPDYVGAFPHDALTEDDYVPVDAKRGHIARFCCDGAQVTLETGCGGQPEGLGQPAAGAPGTIHYDLGDGTFAGGRFVFWLDDDGGYQAEFTLYGSGRPIVQSDRGAFRAITCP